MKFLAAVASFSLILSIGTGGSHWNLEVIQFHPAIYEARIVSDEIIIASIGVGVSPDPEYEDRLLTGYAVSGGSAWDDQCLWFTGHDRQIMRVAAGSLTGIARQAQIMPIKVAYPREYPGYGPLCFAWANEVAEGIIWATDHGADVIIVLVSFSANSRIVHDAVDYASTNGVTVTAGAGNNDNTEPTYPASWDGVISVIATDQEGNRMIPSSYGEESISAPGEACSIDFNCSSGSSTAAGHVAGLAALILGVHPEYNADQVVEAIENGLEDIGTPGVDAETGRGRINVYRSVVIEWEYTYHLPLIFRGGP